MFPNRYGIRTIPDEVIDMQKKRNGITNMILETLKGPTITAEMIADAAYNETSMLPVATPEERLSLMLGKICEGREDLEADIIAACRKKAGVQ